MLNASLQQAVQMVDLKGQHRHIAQEITEAIQEVMASCAFINGPTVRQFAESLAAYTGARQVIPCGNGTDALQIAMMGLGLQPGDEVIVPTFTYVATVEVIALLGLRPVLVDVHPGTFNLDVEQVAQRLTEHTRAVVPVHLFGQCADMQPLLDLARQHGFHVIEDAAQSLGATYRLADGTIRKAGTLGTIGTTSFFPSKNLGGCGDGGALFTDDAELAARVRAIGNHGQLKKYHHDRVGINSRLDSLQAAILNIKLRYLDEYSARRTAAAHYYDQALANVAGIQRPVCLPEASPVYNQYTLRVFGGKREALRQYLKEQEIPSMVYYPMPLHLQQAYRAYGYREGDFPVAETLCHEVLSLPMHTELEEAQQAYIVHHIKQFLHG